MSAHKDDQSDRGKRTTAEAAALEYASRGWPCSPETKQPLVKGDPDPKTRKAIPGTGGLKKASILPLAEKGIVGRGILIDMARYRGKPWLDKGETFTHEDLMAAAEAQGCEISKHDILLVRTGWLGYFYATPKEEFYDGFVEPGLTYSPELVRWFQEMEIPNLVTDTIANEVTTDPESGVALPLHNALMRNLGVTFAEIIALDALAEDCAEDGQYTFLYTAAPLKVVEGSGAPVNPVVIK